MYNFLASNFIHTVRQDDCVYIIDENRFGSFGFEWKKNYTGLMARPARTGRNRGTIARAKQGLFDIAVISGDVFAGDITHRAILEAVLETTTEERCIAVWQGVKPSEIAHSDYEHSVLLLLLLLFFEQELNWGNEDWQRGTNFAPKVTMPNRVRPRDMLMGYISQAYSLGIEGVAWWQNIRPSTTTFIAPDGSTKYFQQYPRQYKRFFDVLCDNPEASALMVRDVRIGFRELANTFGNNPNY